MIVNMYTVVVFVLEVLIVLSIIYAATRRMFLFALLLTFMSVHVGYEYGHGNIIQYPESYSDQLRVGVNYKLFGHSTNGKIMVLAVSADNGNYFLIKVKGGVLPPKDFRLNKAGVPVVIKTPR